MAKVRTPKSPASSVRLVYYYRWRSNRAGPWEMEGVRGECWRKAGARARKEPECI